MSGIAAVEVEGLVKRYRAGVEGCQATVEVLGGIDLTVHSGEVLAVAGPPGAGKSTLLSCIAGLLRPDAGRVMWFGRRRGYGPPEGIAFAPEHAVHYAFLTVRESLEYHATLQDLPGARGRIDDALARSAMRAHARFRISLLDRALRQRLGIARALLGNPRLLVLDAPMSALDRAGRRDTAAILRALRDDGLTMLVSAREPWEMAELASRTVTLVAGRIRAEHSRARAGESVGIAAPPHPFAGGGLVAEHLS